MIRSSCLVGMTVAALVLTGCSSSNDTASSTPSSVATTSSPAASSTTSSPAASTDPSVTTSSADSGATGSPTLMITDGALGAYLTDADGKTLYMFEADTAGSSTCYDKCATAWPALTVTGDPIAGDGVDQSLLTTVERTDGTMQVKYGEYPLYYFFKDAAAGDTNGQGSNGAGAPWWVVGADGEPIQSAGTATSSS